MSTSMKGRSFEKPVNSYSWQRTHAEVIPTGDLEWKPEPFIFEAGASTRYIDFANGDDNNPGTSKEKPWKHHPWDANATGNAANESGIHTYVFKRGVIYRGSLTAKHSGEKGNPIRLTSDPSWGEGEAMIYGSEQLTGGWKRLDPDEEPGIPDADKIWYMDIGTDYIPRCLWEVSENGITRLDLARTPNWKVSNYDDVKSEWWEWEDAGTTKTEINGRERELHFGTDVSHLAREKEYYEGALIWSEWMPVMGTPYATEVEKFDPENRTIYFQGFWHNASSPVIRGNRYYLENKLEFLDADGEWYYDEKGRHPGRLYLRLPGDRDPNTACVEVAHHCDLINIANMNHIHVSGLTFRFTNVGRLSARLFEDGGVDFACIRQLGSSQGLRISNNRFEHVNQAVRIKAVGGNDYIDDITITDNDISFLDHGAIEVEDGSAWGMVNPPIGNLGKVEVLRNRLYMIGMRPVRSLNGHALVVQFAEEAEIAGNMLDRCYGAGIYIFGGKSSDLRHKPLSRVLIHHNKVTDPLLNTNDWGGIESWQGGPFYIYNNVSGNPGGYWHWKHKMYGDDPEKRDHTTARFGHAYYLDGSFKNYLFNNIGWGKSNDLGSSLANTAALQEIIGFQNAFFNNTFYNFAAGSRRQAPDAGRNVYLGNIWMNMSETVFYHSEAKGAAKEGNAEHVGAVDKKYAYETLGYANNIFYGKPRYLSVFDSTGEHRKNVAEFSKALKDRNALQDQAGWEVNESPVRNAADHDFRLVSGSPAVGKGIKYFVPWSLYGTVGEWNFYRNNEDPGLILDDHWYMDETYINRSMYKRIPRHHLKGVNITAESYLDGELENWTKGALSFNGKDQYCFIEDAAMREGFQYAERRDKIVNMDGDKRKTLDMDTNSFLIEVYFKAEPEQLGGAIVSKADGRAGYELAISKSGYAELKILASGITETATGKTKLDDGKWHHLIAEADRVNGSITIYLDGKIDNETGFEKLESGVSLSNRADFIVGKSLEGAYFAGVIDFLRICRGTLRDSKTTIEELYAWEFDGPFLRDFNGIKPAGKNRDAGAIQAD